MEALRKADGSMAPKDELEEDARRYSANFASAMYSTIPTKASRHVSKTPNIRSLLRMSPPGSEQHVDFVSVDW